MYFSSVSNAAGQASRNVPYRHTVEPFLAFALTRSIPNAVYRRLQSSISASAALRDTFRSRK